MKNHAHSNAPCSARAFAWHQAIRLLAAVAAFAATITTAPLALAGTLHITVQKADGQPAADVAVLVQPTAGWQPPPLPEPAVITQQYIRFVPFVSVVPVGGSVRFINRDRFDHHVRSQPGGPLGNVPPARQFEFRMAAMLGNRPAPAAELKLDVPGSLVVGCHLHGSMRGHILVSSTPWYAVTNDAGVATIHNVPDGQAELRVWHPDQLVEQASTTLQVAGQQQAKTQLNFNPRRRPAPSAPPDNSGY